MVCCCWLAEMKKKLNHLTKLGPPTYARVWIF